MKTNGCYLFIFDGYSDWEPAVTSGNSITANGASMIEFADAVYKSLQTADDAMLEKISVLYKSGGMDYRF